MLRTFVAAASLYTLGRLLLWTTVYRHPNSDLAPVGYLVVALMWLTFVVTAGRLALTVRTRPVAKAALVSSAAVFTAGLIRTALAAAGMKSFLVWDHDHVVAEAIVAELLFAVASMALALVVAVCSLRLFKRSPYAPGSGVCREKASENNV